MSKRQEEINAAYIEGVCSVDKRALNYAAKLVLLPFLCEPDVAVSIARQMGVNHALSAKAASLEVKLLAVKTPTYTFPKYRA